VYLVTDTLKYISSFEAQAHGHENGILIKMKCYSCDYTGAIVPGNEIERVGWLEYKDKDKCSMVDQIVFDYLKNMGVFD
jgi:hypothetical protein